MSIPRPSTARILPRRRAALAAGAIALWGAACLPAPGRSDAGADAAQLPVCQERCRATSDCGAGFTCDDVNRCTVSGTAAHSCSSDEDCLRSVSGWTRSCSTAAPCSGEVCVAISGGYFCAKEPDQSTECARLQMQEVTLLDVDGAQVTVCGKTGYQCRDGACVRSCVGDADCLVPELPLCNRATGECECQAVPVDSCPGTATGGQVCRAGRCGCEIDRDCTAPGRDHCQGGQCVCASAASCAAIRRAHPATTWVCESPLAR